VVGGATLEQHWRTGTAVERIREGGFDYVVLQEQSLRPIDDPERLLDYGVRFAREIRQSGAQPVVFLTWSRRERPASQDTLDQAVGRLAAATQALLVPAGPAWQELRRLDATADLYDDDGSHPSPLGSYVAAQAFYRVLYGRPAPARAECGPVEERDPVASGRTPLSSELPGPIQRAVETAVGRYAQRSR
jgi:hypothetical protein